MTGDREEMAERIRAGLDPQPKCPYLHDARARCPNCAEWPRRDEKVVAEVAQLAKELDVAPAVVVRSSLNLRRMGLIMDKSRSAFHLPEPREPTEAQMRTGAGLPGVVESVTREGDTLYGRIRFTEPRAKLLPGVLIDDEVPVVAPVWRIVGRWALGFGMVAAGAAVMYAEGQRRPLPGVGFAIGLSLIVGAAFLVARGRDDG